MKVLIVGGGGREHAIAWRLRRDDPRLELVVAPGNPGIAELARCVDVRAGDVEGLLALARAEAVDFTVVGPEAPLAAGIVDRFREEGLAIFGPSAAAAEIETSKAWAKDLMLGAGVPTAQAVTCTSAAEAMAALERFGAPVVVKASGLAAGKGVIVAHTRGEAESAIEAMFAGRAFGAAGDTVLVEEFMEGEELSLFVVTDGVRVVPLIAAQDHKRLLDGDRGPNTGGMGAYAPVAIADATLISRIVETIVLPTLAAMRDAGRPFTGLLYAGVMLTGGGPKVVEFNCRFGDPETQAVLPILSAAPSLLELMRRVAHGEQLPESVVVAANGAAVTTVVAAAGYPDAPRGGMEIVIPPVEPGVIVFHAGTARGGDGRVVVSGGRVVAVTAVADTIANAAAASRDFAEGVEFEGRQLRRDIAWRELARTSAP